MTKLIQYTFSQVSHVQNNVLNQENIGNNNNKMRMSKSYHPMANKQIYDVVAEKEKDLSDGNIQSLPLATKTELSFQQPINGLKSDHQAYIKV